MSNKNNLIFQEFFQFRKFDNEDSDILSNEEASKNKLEIIIDDDESDIQTLKNDVIIEDESFIGKNNLEWSPTPIAQSNPSKYSKISQPAFTATQAKSSIECWNLFCTFIDEIVTCTNLQIQKKQVCLFIYFNQSILILSFNVRNCTIENKTFSKKQMQQKSRLYLDYCIWPAI